MSEARDVFVRADRVRLAQILDVLVDNAVKFTPAGTRIELRIRVGEDAWVQVDVADQGPGIAPDQLPLMFKPFRQVDGSATRRVGGLGMGLATASRIAEQMGARLGVETAAGRGATFTVSLPRP
jgi:signal transduction histidine kinase